MGTDLFLAFRKIRLSHCIQTRVHASHYASMWLSRQQRIVAVVRTK